MPLLTFLPDGRSLRVKSGLTVLQAAKLHRIPIRTRCSGGASCLMCKIHVSEESAGGLSKPNEREILKLGNLLEQGVRLACQTKVHADAVVTIPEDPLKAVIRAKLANLQQEDIW